MLQDDLERTKLHRPRLGEQLFFFASGIITSIPLTLFVGAFTDSLCLVLPVFYASICSVAIFTPFIEEFAKTYPLFYRHGETERSIFSLGFLVGLGFGVAEFFLYILVLGAPIYVRLAGLIFHATSTSITAFGIAKKQPVPFYLVAVALHLTNNLAVVVGPFFPLGINVAGVVVTAIAVLLSWRLYHKTAQVLVE